MRLDKSVSTIFVILADAFASKCLCFCDLGGGHTFSGDALRRFAPLFMAHLLVTSSARFEKSSITERKRQHVFQEEWSN